MPINFQEFQPIQHQETPLPFETAILKVAQLDLKKIPDTLSDNTWRQLHAANLQVNNIFSDAKQAKSLQLGCFPIITFQVDKKYPEFTGELVRIASPDTDIYILRHPTLYDNQLTNRIDVISQTTLFYPKRIDARLSLVATFDYLTDETHSLIEGNPRQAKLLQQRGIRTDNRTSFFGLRAKTVKWEMWFKKNSRNFINVPFPVTDEHGRLLIPNPPSPEMVDPRNLQQLFEEHSNFTEDGLTFTDNENLLQDVRNAFATKWKYIFDDAQQKFRFSQVNENFLKETTKLLKSMQPDFLSTDRVPLLPGDMSKQLSTRLMQLTTQQMFTSY